MAPAPAVAGAAFFGHSPKRPTPFPVISVQPPEPKAFCHSVVGEDQFLLPLARSVAAPDIGGDERDPVAEAERRPMESDVVRDDGVLADKLHAPDAIAVKIGSAAKGAKGSPRPGAQLLFAFPQIACGSRWMARVPSPPCSSRCPQSEGGFPCEITNTEPLRQ